MGFDERYFKLFGNQMVKIKARNPLGVHGVLSFNEMHVRKALDVNVETCKFIGLMDFGKEEVNDKTTAPKRKKTENVENSSTEVTTEKNSKYHG